MGNNSFLVDIPSGWDPRAKQQPTGLIAYSADCAVRAALFKSCRPEYTKKDTRMGVFLSLKRLFVGETVGENFHLRNSTLTVIIFALHGSLSKKEGELFLL